MWGRLARLRVPRRLLSDEFASLKPVKPPVFLPGDAGKAATSLYVEAVRAEQLEQVVKDVQALAGGKYKDLDKFVNELDVSEKVKSCIDLCVCE
jgi:hypothetical protein